MIFGYFGGPETILRIFCIFVILFVSGGLGQVGNVSEDASDFLGLHIIGVVNFFQRTRGG